MEFCTIEMKSKELWIDSTFLGAVVLHHAGTMEVRNLRFVVEKIEMTMDNLNF